MNPPTHGTRRLTLLGTCVLFLASACAQRTDTLSDGKSSAPSSTGTADASASASSGSAHADAGGSADADADADADAGDTSNADSGPMKTDAGAAIDASASGSTTGRDAGLADAAKPFDGAAAPDGAGLADAATREASAPLDAAGTVSPGGSDAAAAALANPAPGSNFFIGANFWNADWEPAEDYFASGVDFATTQNPWRPELLADLAPYRVLRFMDWNQTNNANNPQASWSTRRQKTAPQAEPIAFEWQIDLCNRTHKDYWLNVPHESTADDWKKLAELVRDQLDPSLRVYLEWSNEVWNAGFPQASYAASHGTGLGLPGASAAQSFYVYSAVRVWETFASVFGKDSSRIVKVLAGQAAWTGPCQDQMKALTDTTINPHATQPTVYAIAPYFGGSTTAELRDAIATTAGWTRDHAACVASTKLPLISYEGGSDMFSAPNNGCVDQQQNPDFHDLYGSYLDALSAAGMTGPFVQYTHVGNCWGLKQKTSDSLESSPKYQGVLDWLSKHP